MPSILGLHPGHELLLCCNHDCGDDGVKAGLGWYMNWAKSWAAYDKMFAALFVICFIFTIVTKVLDLIKRRVLRWQNGVVK